MAIGSAIGAIGGALLGGGGKSGAKKAAKAQVEAARIAAETQKEIYGQNKAMLSPFTNAATPATANINALLGLGGDREAANNAFQGWLDDSNYAFDLNRGLNAVNSGYAGAGTLKSGAAMKGVEDYRQNLQNAYRGQYMQNLGNQQAVGLTAASALAGVGQNFANSLGQIEQNKADAISNAALVKGQNSSNNFNSMLGFAGSILGKMF